MKSEDNNFTTAHLDDAIEALSKNLYLESPDLWIEFQDKMGDKVFDEMVLFFAAKYNSFSIITHAVENNLINLDSPSRNKSYSTVRDHIISVAKKNKHTRVCEYLTDPNSLTSDSSDNTSAGNTIEEVNQMDLFIPKFTCPTCNTNVFESGYIVSTNSIYKFSKDEKTSKKISQETLDSVVCCNCNSTIKGITPEKLEILCHVHSCSKCGLDLKTIGIIDKLKMDYDKGSDKFIQKSASYHCSNCDNKISDYQKEYFNL